MYPWQGSEQAWARYLDVPIEKTNSLGMKLRLVPPGQYSMGPFEGHFVRITHACYFGEYEVTRGQFAQFVAATSFRTLAEVAPGGIVLENAEQPTKWLPDKKSTWRDPGFAQEDDHPVVQIAWNDAVAFCEWLSKKENAKYRLPTEAEWEYACRAGTVSRYYNGNEIGEVTEIANVADASAKKVFPKWGESVTTSDGYVYTSPVGHFRPNNFGLYDMLGNAAEWCSDRHDADYFKHSPTDDPQGPESGNARSDGAAASPTSPVRGTATTEPTRFGGPIGVSGLCATSTPRRRSPCRQRSGRFTRVPESRERGSQEPRMIPAPCATKRR